jgi:Spy/CpxP family protein refolding chaperone
MKKLVVVSLAAAALAGSVFALGAAAAPGDPSPAAAQMRDMAEARAFMLDARLAGMKAALKLTPEQEKDWAPFEAAVRDAAKTRMEEMIAMREAMRGAERPSPIEHMNMMADRLAKASADLKAISAAAKPLYDSLDETQKSHFGPLLMTMREHRPHEGGMWGHWRPRGPDEGK